MPGVFTDILLNSLYLLASFKKQEKNILYFLDYNLKTNLIRRHLLSVSRFKSYLKDIFF